MSIKSDLFAAIYNTHGDTAKIVLSPSTVEEAFYNTFEAFNLAEEYQCSSHCPCRFAAFLATQTMVVPEYERLSPRRGKLADGTKLPPIKSPEYSPAL